MSNRLLFIILIIFAVADVILAAWYLKLVPVSGITQILSTRPEISTVSDVPNVSFSIADKNRLEQALNKLHFFDTGRVVIVNTSQSVTVKKVVFKLTATPQIYNRIQDGKNRIISSVGQIYDKYGEVMEIDLYFSPTYLSENPNDILAKSATGKIFAFMYQLTTGSALTNMTDIIQQSGAFSRSIIKEGVIFSVIKK